MRYAFAPRAACFVALLAAVASAEPGAELPGRIQEVLVWYEEGSGSENAAARREIAALGADALPLLEPMLDSEEGRRLGIVADVLGDARYGPAGWRLRRLLAGDPPGDPGRLVRALARLGDPVVIRLVRSAGAFDALPALAALGTPSAIAALDARLHGLRSERRRWLRPPRPDPAASGDGTPVLFADPLLGGDLDQWVATVDRGGREVTLFVGESMAVARGASYVLSGEGVELVRDDAAAGDASASAGFLRLADLAADGDGDGLTDRMEERLRLDPRSEDTDGDGLPDVEDLVPGAVDAPASDEDRIAMAIVGFMTALKEDDGLVVVSYPRALPWPTRRGPVVTVSGAVEEALLAETGHYFQGGVQPISFERMEAVTADERRYDVWGWGHTEIAVGVVDGRWYVTDAVALPFE